MERKNQMTKFKVGDKVLFYFKAGQNISDPPLNTVHQIIKIDGFPGRWQYYYGLYPEHFFFEEEIKLANSQLIKEKLGIK